jgi:hypothetical protein
LIGRKTKGHIDHVAFSGQNLAGLQAVSGQRQFYGDVRGDPCQFTAFGNIIVGFDGDNFSGNRTIDHVTDFFGHLKNVTTGLEDQRRVCGNTTDHPEVAEHGDFWDLGCVDKKLHGGCHCGM